MSALAAATLVAAEGVEPILHVITRDRNRIALVSDALGGAGPGHPQPAVYQRHAIEPRAEFRAARNVFDVDPDPAAASLQRHWRQRRPFARRAGRWPPAGRSASVAWPIPMPIRWNCKSCGWARSTRPGRSSSSRSRSTTWTVSTPGGQEVRRRASHEKVAIVAGMPPLASAAKWPNCGAQPPPAADSEAAVRGEVAGRFARGPAGRPALRSPWKPSRGLRNVKGLRRFPDLRRRRSWTPRLEVLEKSALGK